MAVPRLSVLLLRLALVILVVALSVGACGDDQTPNDSTTVSITGATVAIDSTSLPASPSSTSLPDTTTLAEPGITSTSGPTTASSEATTTTAAATTTTSHTTTTAQTTTTAPKGPTVLKISGPAGTKELSMADLKAMSASSGYGGWKNDLGNITGPTAWKGVSLRSLMELVGGGGSVTIIASDGYTQTLSAAEAAGAVNAYDPATGEPVTGVSVKAIVAYAKGGGALGSNEGPLRVAFVSSEQNQVTDSKMWVRQVIELRVD